MNRLKSPLRRALAVAAGTLIGVTGAVAFAAPASAHHSEVEPKAVCDTVTGEWVVTWTVRSYAPGDAPNYRLEKAELEPAGSTVTNIKVTEGEGYPHVTNTPLVGEQRLPGDAAGAKLTVRAKWSNGFAETNDVSGSITFEAKCEKDSPKPDATIASTCEGVTVTLLNGENAKADAFFTIKSDKGFEKTVTVEPGQKDVTVDIPADKAGKIVVTEKGSEKPVAEGQYVQPEDCVEPTEPQRFYEATCTELIFTIDNTKGTEDVTTTLTPNKGEAKTLTAKPGLLAVAKFEGTKGLEVTPTEGDEVYDTVKWDDEKPEDCDEGGEAGGGGSLPVTGAAAGGIAGGAAVLLVIGAVLFFIARRRRVTFTA